MLTDDKITQLKQSLRGKLIQPHDDDYDTARKVYNGMINKRPALIAKCVNVADVITAVNFARENDILTVAVHQFHDPVDQAVFLAFVILQFFVGEVIVFTL